MSTRKTGLMALRTQDPQLNQFADGVMEQLEVLHGARGDPLDRAITLRDLQGMGFDVSAMATKGRSGAGGRAGGGAGSPSAVAPLIDAAARQAVKDADMDAFAKSLMDTQLFKDLMAPTEWRQLSPWRDANDPARLDWVPEQLRRELLLSIAEEAAKRGTDISRVEKIVKDGANRYASKLEEITAAMGAAAAGVRDLTFAYADADRAVAGKITQLGATLGGNIATLEQSLSTEVTKTSAIASSVTTLQTRVGTAEAAITSEQTARSNADGAIASSVSALQTRVGTAEAAISTEQTTRANADSANATSINQVQARLNPGGDFAAVKLESSATAGKVTGLEAQYTMKVTAGGAIAGIGLSATSSSSGNATSAIIMTADKFAIVAPGYSGGLTNSPPAGAFPFAVESAPSGNSKIYINGNVRVRGGLDVSATYGSGFWASDAAFGINVYKQTGIPNLNFNNYYAGQCPSKSIASGNDVNYLYAGHYGKAMGTSSLSVGVVGDAVGSGSNACVGIVGTATGGRESYGGVFSGPSADIALIGSGVIVWGGTAVAKPNGSAASFLNGLGQWVTPSAPVAVAAFNNRTGSVTLSSADVTNALGYTPPTSASVSNEVNANNANYILPNFSRTTHTHSSAPYATDAGALGGIAASSYFRFTGSTTGSSKTFAGYAQVLVSGGYYWIPIYQ